MNMPPTTTVASDGYYRFEDVPFSTYTMHATYPGYAEGTCTKTTSSSQDWCSIALFPDTSGGDNGGSTDTGGGTETGVPTDTAPNVDDTALPGDVPVQPGNLVMSGEAGAGCGCAVADPAAAGWAVGAALLALARRRRA